MRALLFVVRIPLSLAFVAVATAIWLVAAPLAFLLGLAGWGLLRGTYEEKFRWGEAVLQRARALTDRLARFA
jgi:hypothetical protein